MSGTGCLQHGRLHWSCQRLCRLQHFWRGRIQVFNQASIQNFQGMSTSVTVDTADDMFVDSVLASDMQLQSRNLSVLLHCFHFSSVLYVYVFTWWTIELQHLLSFLHLFCFVMPLCICLLTFQN